MIAQERLLELAPRAATADPVRARAAAAAVAHARRLVVLPRFDLVWVRQPGGVAGQTIIDSAGKITVLLNAENPARGHVSALARETIVTTLHELGHVRDFRTLHKMSAEEAEARAHDFGGWALESFPWEDLR